jgi:hypothetical protein
MSYTMTNTAPVANSGATPASMTNTSPVAATPDPNQAGGLELFGTGGDDSDAVFANVSSHASYTFETPFPGVLVDLTGEATLEADIDQEQAVVPSLWPNYMPIAAGITVTIRAAVGFVGDSVSDLVEFREAPDNITP